MSELSGQPPPRKGARPGYYPDPLGSGRARFWDGAAWTPTIGPKVEQGAPKGKALPPPAKVCRHCAAQSETFESTCPNCGQSYGRISGWAIAAIAAGCVVFVLFLGGCGLLFALIASKAGDENSITERQFDSVQIGSTLGQVEGQLGDPFDSVHENDPPHGRVLCISYTQDDGDVFDIFNPYEFCFENGLLYEKRLP